MHALKLLLCLMFLWGMTALHCIYQTNSFYLLLKTVAASGTFYSCYLYGIQKQKYKSKSLARSY